MAERLQKFLSRAGVASRRRAEELIAEGRVKVNGEVVGEPGTKVEPGKDLVQVDGQLVEATAERGYFILYKPEGVVTTLVDPEGRPTVADCMRGLERRVYPVGRLDYDAEGALLLTDDGELAHRLMHPSFQVPRTYLAKVKGVPDEATLDKLRGGVRLEDGMARPLSVDLFERAEKNTWLKLVLGEGRTHLVKRLCAAVGHPVVRLFRPHHAGVGLEGLSPGELRPLTAGEVEALKAVSEGRAAGGEPAIRLPARRHGRAEEEGGAEEGGERPPRRFVEERGAGERAEEGGERPRSGQRGAGSGRERERGEGRGARSERPAFGKRGAGDRPRFGGRGAGGQRGEEGGGDRPRFGGRGAGGQRTEEGAGDRPRFGGRGAGGQRTEEGAGDRPRFGGRGAGGQRGEEGGGRRPRFGGRSAG
ncbi:MAG TPA: pseudouridine synthase, partial [Myxococcales bacterium]|nr:pseudouridine synthase [Myxococcales bacterium]